MAVGTDPKTRMNEKQLNEEPLARKQSESTRVFKVKIFNPFDSRDRFLGALSEWLLKEQSTKLFRLNELESISRKMIDKAVRQCVKCKFRISQAE